MTDTWYRDLPEDFDQILRAAADELGMASPSVGPRVKDFTVVKSAAYMPHLQRSGHGLYGLIPDTRPPYAPTPWRTRLRWRISALRERAAVNLYRLAAGHDLEPRDDD